MTDEKAVEQQTFRWAAYAWRVGWAGSSSGPSSLRKREEEEEEGVLEGGPQGLLDPYFRKLTVPHNLPGVQGDGSEVLTKTCTCIFGCTPCICIDFSLFSVENSAIFCFLSY